MNEETVIKLEKFLKNHRAYSRFMENVRTHRDFGEEESLTLTNIVDELLSVISKINLISSSFGWSDTPQGHKYWARLSEKWRESLG